MLKTFKGFDMVNDFNDLIISLKEDIDVSNLEDKVNTEKRNFFIESIKKIGIDTNYVEVDFDFAVNNSAQEIMVYIDQLRYFHNDLCRIYDKNLSISTINISSYMVEGKLDLRSISNVEQLVASFKTCNDVVEFVSKGTGNKNFTRTISNSTILGDNPYVLFSESVIKNVSDIDEKYQTDYDLYNMKCYLSGSERLLLVNIQEKNRNERISREKRRKIFKDNIPSLIFSGVLLFLSVSLAFILNSQFKDDNQSHILFRIVPLVLFIIMPFRVISLTIFRKKRHSNAGYAIIARLLSQILSILFVLFISYESFGTLAASSTTILVFSGILLLISLDSNYRNVSGIEFLLLYYLQFSTSLGLKEATNTIFYYPIAIKDFFINIIQSIQNLFNLGVGMTFVVIIGGIIGILFVIGYVITYIYERFFY